MSITNFKDLIYGDEYNKVIFEEYDFIQISQDNNKRSFKRTNYKLNKLRNIDFPFVLLNLIEDLLDKINVELTVNETYTHNNVNYYCNLKSELEHYKFIEDIYYSLDLKCDNNNNITIQTSIDKKYNENNINEIDKFILNLLLFFIENTYTSYVKNEIFKKKLNRINLHSFVLNIT
jgi:hypothetical protein